uniref:Uncharacterized protein n=1 Tax=Anguilla anguilla TaxID=7936 RepID=A0A0E9XHD7_ANGAN
MLCSGYISQTLKMAPFQCRGLIEESIALSYTIEFHAVHSFLHLSLANLLCHYPKQTYPLLISLDSVSSMLLIVHYLYLYSIIWSLIISKST